MKWSKIIDRERDFVPTLQELGLVRTTEEDVLPTAQGRIFAFAILMHSAFDGFVADYLGDTESEKIVSAILGWIVDGDPPYGMYV